MQCLNGLFATDTDTKHLGLTSVKNPKAKLDYQESSDLGKGLARPSPTMVNFLLCRPKCTHGCTPGMYIDILSLWSNITC